MKDSGVNNKSGGLLLKPAKLTDEDVKTYEKNTKAYKKDLKTKTKVGDMEGISPFHVSSEPNHVQDIIDKTRERHNPLCQVNAKLLHDDKTALYVLIKSKGCDGLTSFLKMLAKAKEVSITI